VHEDALVLGRLDPQRGGRRRRGRCGDGALAAAPEVTGAQQQDGDGADRAEGELEAAQIGHAATVGRPGARLTPRW
jgi:hypothetical protein